MTKKYFFILFGIVVFSGLFQIANAEKIVYSNTYPTWYSYDCTDSAPSTWTQQQPPEGNAWKYFNFYNGDCFGNMLTFNLDDLANIENVTAITYYVDSRALVPNNNTANDQYQVNCKLLYFADESLTSTISLSPDIINSFDCTGTAGQVQEIIIPYSSAQNTTLTNAIQAGEFQQSFMIWGDFNSTVRTSLDSNDDLFGVGKFRNELSITGDGFNCVTIQSSNWCNFYNEPWEAVKKALGEDYIGQWFYVFIFFPFPISVFLITRNGAYAGFVCLPIILIINTIDQVVYEISLSMIFIASAFGFYEMIRKKIHE